MASKRGASRGGRGRGRPRKRPRTIPTSLPATTATPLPSPPDHIQLQDLPETPGASFFLAHRAAVNTSNLSLADLHIAPASELDRALAAYNDPLKEEQGGLMGQLLARVSQFRFWLHANFSLLFYGFGSKYALLQALAHEFAESGTVVVLNGFNPTASLRAVLTQIAVHVLKLSCFQRRSLADYVVAIREALLDAPHPLFLVIHNLDGVSLRSTQAQQVLSQLAAIPSVSLLASIDHINAPLLWDGILYHNFNFAWIPAHTFLPYASETVFSSKPLLRGRCERRVEAAVALLRSLSKNARRLFRYLATSQMAEKRISFNSLYEYAKTQFLASDPATLRTILTELQTHDLLTIKRANDMSEMLSIPLQKAQLNDILAAVGDE